MKKSVKFGIISCVGLGGLMVADVACAGSMGQVAKNIQKNFGGINDMLQAGGYLGGVGFGINAALKFKEHAVNPQQVKLSQPLSSAAVAGALLSMGTWLDVATESTTGAGANKMNSQTGEIEQQQ